MSYMNVPKELIYLAKVFKEQGNDQFKNHKLDLAKILWKKAVEKLEENYDWKDSGLLDDRNSLLLSLYLNLSLCYLKLNSPVDARDASEQALRLDCKNEKATFRKAQANMELAEYEQAIKDFKAVLEIEPKNAAASKNIQLCNEKIERRLAKEKNIYANMFKKDAKEERQNNYTAAAGNKTTGMHSSKQDAKTETLHEYIQNLGKFEEANEEKVIQKLGEYLDNGGDIDSFFPQTWTFDRPYFGTILHYAVLKRYDKVVEYALSRGANIAAEIIWKKDGVRFKNALENSFYYPDATAELVQKRSLQLYSSYGLKAYHLDCLCQPRVRIPPAEINAAVSLDSPIWPGMTPFLIATKFENCHIIGDLLKLGVDAVSPDPEGNTPLHFLAQYCFTESLFAPNATNTFGPLTGSSHFHLACKNCPEALHIVKRYLSQGISPDLPTRGRGPDSKIPPGQGGLHIAAVTDCTELVYLLLEHGAEIDRKDSNGDTPIEYSFKSGAYEYVSTEFLCSFIETGANMEKVNMNVLLDYLVKNKEKQVFLACIVKLIKLNANLVSAKLKNVYQEVLKKSGGWNEAEHAGRCSVELNKLSCLRIRSILDDTIVVNDDFKNKFGWLESFDYKGYPIYGSLLKLKFKRKLLKFNQEN